MFNEVLTPQAVAAHRRSERARLQRHRKKWGLFADIVPLSPYPTLEEHRERQRDAAVKRLREARKEWARAWRMARARLRALPRERAAELLEEWNGATTGVLAGRRGPDDLLSFLSIRAPTGEVLESRRQARIRSVQGEIASARRTYTWYVAHRSCPEGELGVATLGLAGSRVLRCIGCEKAWRTRKEVLSAEESGEIEIVDCRLAVQLDLL